MTALPAFGNRGIGLLGGTFDPIHNGHLAIAREARRALHLAWVDLLLAPRPWQKRVLTSVETRAAMICEALKGEEGLRLNLTEAFRDGPTYTIDTLRELRKENGPSTPIILLMGMDQWANLETWRDWESLTDYASLAVFNRGAESPFVPEALRTWARGRIVPAGLVNTKPCGAVGFFSMPPHAASSTALREMLSRARSVDSAVKLDQWLPHGVASYIHSHGLYARNFKTTYGHS